MKIAVGIVLYRTPYKFLYRCLESIKNQQLVHNQIASVILYDASNGYSKNDIEDVSNALGLEALITFFTGDNVGFGAGHNRIYQKAEDLSFDFDAYLCLNPDSVLHPNAAENLASFSAEHENSGIFEAMQFPVPHPKVYDTVSGRTAWCSGCCLLIPRELYTNLKGFDESFFLYCEDVDISWRVKSLGGQCYSVQNALVYHWSLERDDDSMRLRWMFYSGAILGYKWRAHDFSSSMVNELKARFDMSLDLNELKSSVPVMSNEAVMKANPDFSKGFSFSDVFWR